MELGKELDSSLRWNDGTSDKMSLPQSWNYGRVDA